MTLCYAIRIMVRGGYRRELADEQLYRQEHDLRNRIQIARLRAELEADR